MRAAFFFAVLFSAFSASAQQADPERDALFKRLDRNGDGYLSAQELRSEQALEGNWIAVDRDGDGRISLSEFGIVRNFAQAANAAAGGTQPAKKEPARADGQPPKAPGQP
jgi:Ca2+-binding EF-hand superfamily protein